MVRLPVALIFIGYVVAATISFAQGPTAVPFLLISPYAEANGMGETSVACLTDDPLAFTTNPAHLGMQSQSDYFSSGYNHSYWLPGFQQSDLWLKTFAFNAGINLKKALGITPELSFGLAYSRIYLNLGQFVVTGDDPTPVATFDGYETSDQYSLGVGINYWVKASAGVTFKHVSSTLAAPDFQGEWKAHVATVNTYDYGLLLNVPLIGIISQLREEPIRLLPSVSPFFDFNIGFSNNNLGDKELISSDNLQGEPLPRYARAGIGLDLGITFRKDEMEWQPLSFKWTIEANDLLVSRYPSLRDSTGNVIKEGGWEYQHGMGDINFFDEVILGKTNSETIKKKGWELNFFKIISIRGGRFEEDPNRGNRRFNTSGYGVQSEGFFKLLRAIGVPLATDKVFVFIADHINVRYNHSELTTDEANNPLSGTSFNSINILFSN